MVLTVCDIVVNSEGCFFLKRCDVIVVKESFEKKNAVILAVSDNVNNRGTFF